MIMYYHLHGTPAVFDDASDVLLLEDAVTDNQLHDVACASSRLEVRR